MGGDPLTAIDPLGLAMSAQINTAVQILHGSNEELDDGPGQMNNVNINENPIRLELVDPARTSYIAPKIQWMSGTK